MARTVRGLAIALVSAALMSLALMLLLAWSQPVNAGGGCVDTYTVRRGDTLSQIAHRLGIPLDELWAANRDRIANPDRIYVGQALCLPESGSPSGGPAAKSPVSVDSKAVLDVWYRYTPSDAEDKLELPRSGELGKRVELPLLPTHPVTVFTLTSEITQAMAGGLNPLLVGVRNRDAAGKLVMTYTLVAIGTGELLGRLAISDTLSIMPSAAPGQAKPVLTFLQQARVERAALYLWLEGGDGVRWPFYISDLDVAPDYLRFKQFYLDRRANDPEARVRADDIGFALFPAAGGRYHMMLRFSSDGYGPPYWTTATRCDAWRTRQGRWFWFFRFWYGCRG